MKYQAGDTIEVVLSQYMANCFNDPNDEIISIGLDDITKHTPKPFDWTEAKQGMAFIKRNNETVWFVANDFTSKDIVIITKRGNLCKDSLWFEAKYNLTRAPEHDKEV